MKATSTNEDFSEMHEPHWVLRGAFQLLVFGLVSVILLAVTVHRGLIWLAVLLLLVVSHLMHGISSACTKAHGLRKNHASMRRWAHYRHAQPDELPLYRRSSNALPISRRV
jgi:hypothetical protein